MRQQREHEQKEHRSSFHDATVSPSGRQPVSRPARTRASAPGLSLIVGQIEDVPRPQEAFNENDERRGDDDEPDDGRGVADVISSEQQQHEHRDRATTPKS